MKRLAGAEVAFRRDDERLCATVVVLGLPELELLEAATACGAVPAPYRPGSLALREAPAILEALTRLRARPWTLLVRGHGMAHPNKFGLACAVGVAADLPTVGVATSRLVGTHGAVSEQRGSWMPLEYGAGVVGAVVRTRPGVRPVFVSVGHRFTLEEAVAVVLDSSPRFRLPEPLREARAQARRALKAERGG